MADRGAMTVTMVGPGQFLATGQISNVATGNYMTLDLPGGYGGATVVAVDVRLSTLGDAANVRPVIAAEASVQVPQLEAESAAVRSYFAPGDVPVRASSGGRLFVFPVPNVNGGALSVVDLEIRGRVGWP